MGLRRSLMRETAGVAPGSIDFLEVAPENWIGLGGARRREFDTLVGRYPLVLHGLSLDLGGNALLNTGLVAAVRDFMRRHRCTYYSEHLTACGDGAQLYDLMPLSFTDGAVRHVTERICRVQDILGQRMAVENASYYLVVGQDMDELDFINAVIAEADCDLMLDVNNIIVNSINHGYDAVDFLHGLPGERITYVHVAGHANEAHDLRVDTHGAEVAPATWELLEECYRYFGVKPTLLERDSSFPPFAELMTELERIRTIQARVAMEHAGPGRTQSASHGHA